MLSLMVLFGNFYIKQYLQKRRGAKAAVANDDDVAAANAYRAKRAAGGDSSLTDSSSKSPYARQPLHSSENGHSVRNGKKKES